MRKQWTISASLVLVLPALVSAEGFDPAARAKAVAPFLDEQAVVVGHVNLAADPAKKTPYVDVDVMMRLLLDGIQPRESGTKVSEDVKKGLDEVKTRAAEFVASFTQAGGTDAYFIVSVADLPQGEVPVVILPWRAGMDLKKLADLFGVDDNVSPAAKDDGVDHIRKVCERVGDAVFVGRKHSLERIQKMQPSARPELVKAFEAAGDTAAQVLLLPTVDARRVIEDMFPTLPESLGGAPITTLTRGVMWAALGIENQPAPGFRLIIQSENADAAKAFGKTVDDILKAVRDDKEIQKAVPSVAVVVEMLKLKIDGDQARLAMKENDLKTLVARVLAPMVQEGRTKATRVAAMNNIKQILMGCIMYAADHKNEWPADLQAVLDAKLIDPRVMVNPRQSEKKVGYVYIRPSSPKDINHKTIVVYEVYEEWGEGIAVGYGDGHVEFQKNEAEFKKALGATPTKPAANP